MGIDTSDLRRLIQETLVPRKLWSQGVEELLIMTVAVESDGGSHLYQYGLGPASGIFQMERATEEDIWSNYIAYRPSLSAHLDGVQRHLPGNIVYQIIMARILYMRCKAPIPAHTDIKGLARYYKDIWNTPAGKSTVEIAIEKYKKYR